MTSARPYHHGNLRQAVLDQAFVMLRDTGASDLSLRELTATIGVTHAAPRRYFPDRQSLLDAVAAEGFARLGSRLREAAAAAPGYRPQVRAVASAYVDFTVTEANLVELMFAHQRGADEGAVAQSATDAFAPLLEVFRRARDEGLLPAQEPEQIALIFLATLQGITGLTHCGVIPVEQLDGLVEAAVAQFDFRQG